MPYSDFKKDDSQESSPLIFLAGSSLAMIAGFVNLCFFHHTHFPISHMTGNLTHLAQFFFPVDILMIILGFFCGAMLSGYFLGKQFLNIKNSYGLIMIVEGLILFALPSLIVFQSSYGIILAAFTMGLQNGMVSSYLGLIVRTSHVTGLLTDLGFICGVMLSGKSVKKWKVLFLITLLFGFFTGCLLGELCFQKFAMHSLYFPAVLVLSMGVFFYFLKRQRDFS